MTKLMRTYMSKFVNSLNIKRHLQFIIFSYDYTMTYTEFCLGGIMPPPEIQSKSLEMQTVQKFYYGLSGNRLSGNRLWIEIWKKFKSSSLSGSKVDHNQVESLRNQTVEFLWIVNFVFSNTWSENVNLVLQVSNQTSCSIFSSAK